VEPKVAAQANDPLANFTAFNVHSYYIDKLAETALTAVGRRNL
jgi:hypothetical protein